MSAAALASFGVKALGTLGAMGLQEDARISRKIVARQVQGIKQIQAMQTRRSFLRNARAAISDTTTEATANVGGLDSSAFQGTIGSLTTQREVGVAEQKSLLAAEEKMRKFNKNAEKKDVEAQNLSTMTQLAGDAISAFGGGMGG